MATRPLGSEADRLHQRRIPVRTSASSDDPRTIRAIIPMQRVIYYLVGKIERSVPNQGSQNESDPDSPPLMTRNSLVVSYETLMWAVLLLPRYPLLNRIKSAFLRAGGAKIGRRVVFYPGVWIMPLRGLRIGDDVDLAKGVLITTGGGVTISDRVLVGYGTKILSANHSIPDRPNRIFDAGHVSAPVTIGRDAWIGAACVILPGVEIGEGAVVGAGSVVTKSVPPFAVCAGVPARTIRSR